MMTSFMVARLQRACYLFRCPVFESNQKFYKVAQNRKILQSSSPVQQSSSMNSDSQYRSLNTHRSLNTYHVLYTHMQAYTQLCTKLIKLVHCHVCSPTDALFSYVLLASYNACSSCTSMNNKITFKFLYVTSKYLSYTLYIESEYMIQFKGSPSKGQNKTNLLVQV